MNHENKGSRDLKMVKVEGLCEKVSVEKAMKALKLLNAKKATGPKGVTFELLKVCKKQTVKRLAKRQMICLKERRFPRAGGVI